MKQNRTYSRRRKALFWLTALVVTLAVIVLVDGYNFLPSQTLDYVEGREVLEELEIIHTERGEYKPLEKSLLIVSRNRDHVVLSDSEFSLRRGWSSGNGHVLPLDGAAHHHTWVAGSPDSDKKWVSLFGVVPDGEAAPTFRIILEDYQANKMEELLVVTPESSIRVPGGMVFLEQYGFTLPPKEEQYDIIKLDVQVWKNGEWTDPEHWTVSSYS